MYTRFRNLAHILQDKQGIFTAYYITILHYLSTYVYVNVCKYNVRGHLVFMYAKICQKTESIASQTST